MLIDTLSVKVKSMVMDAPLGLKKNRNQQSSGSITNNNSIYDPQLMVIENADARMVRY